MTKFFGASIAALAIAATAAVAQSPTTGTGQGTTGSMSSTMDKMPSSPLTFKRAIGPSQVLASALMDTSVYSTDGNSIGSVNDVLLDSTGQIDAVVIGVGGFLGVGEKEIAVPYRLLVIQQNAGIADDSKWSRRNKLVISATREQLNTAPDFDKTKIGATTGASMPDDQGPQANVPGGKPAAK